jgi:GTP-binding protein Era
VSTATRCGFAALLGAPNAGKSTLLNSLIRAKVAIVSAKPQTTRSRIAGILTEGEVQAVFVDLPGVFAPRRRLDRAMVDVAWRGVSGADLVILVVDAVRPGGDLEAVIDGLKGRDISPVLVLNKIDAVARTKLLGLAESYSARLACAATFMVSALNGDGVDDLRRHVLAAMPEGPFLYEADQLTDITERLLAAEITREQVFEQLRQELPYAASVETEAWQEREDGSVRIDQSILVERESQKGIVVGAGGARIRALGSAARAELEKVLGRRVHLFLNVKVSEGWAEKRGFYRDWGLDYGA